MLHCAAPEARRPHSYAAQRLSSPGDLSGERPGTVAGTVAGTMPPVRAAAIVGITVGFQILAGEVAFGRIPLWQAALPVVALAVGGFYVLYARDETQRLLRERRHKGLCLHCGLDLTANVSGVCPECGGASPGPRA